MVSDDEEKSPGGASSAGVRCADMAVPSKKHACGSHRWLVAKVQLEPD